MTATTRNEAAERLREWGRSNADYRTFPTLLNKALAAERRATVERIESRFHDVGLLDDEVQAILDEEAVR